MLHRQASADKYSNRSTTKDGINALKLDSKESKHLTELDSLRGAAALCVMFHHWHIIWRATPHAPVLEALIQRTPLRLLIDGNASVMLFFVLSGFVLSIPQVKGRRVQYAAYLLRRVCRIYIPYVVALAAAVAGAGRFHGLHEYGEWFQRTWSGPPSVSLIMQHLLFIGNYDYASYNTAFWTLVEEMRISIIFPFVCFVVLRFRTVVVLIASAAVIGADMAMERYSSVPMIDSRTLTYSVIFGVGILLSKHAPRLGEYVRALSLSMTASLGFIAMAVFIYSEPLCYRFAIPWQLENIAVATAAAVIVLYVSTFKRIKIYFHHPSITYLGKISYSMYLLHGTVLFLFAYLTFNVLPPAMWVAPYFAVTIGLAIPMYHLVERPSIRLGHWLSQSIKRVQ